jgi:hypothetical protein
MICVKEQHGLEKLIPSTADLNLEIEKVIGVSFWE